MAEYTDEDMTRDIAARRAARQAACSHPLGFRPYANLPDDVVACASCDATKPRADSPWKHRT